MARRMLVRSGFVEVCPSEGGGFKRPTLATMSVGQRGATGEIWARATVWLTERQIERVIAALQQCLPVSPPATE